VAVTEEKDARLNFRVTASQRGLIKEAAESLGTSVSEFVMRPAVERARQVLAAEQVTRVRSEAGEAFLEWLDQGAEPVRGMRRLADAEPFD